MVILLKGTVRENSTLFIYNLLQMKIWWLDIRPRGLTNKIEPERLEEMIKRCQGYFEIVES